MDSFEGLIPKELIDDIKNNRCILFVGAGLSCQVKRSNNKYLPTWKGLLEELLDFAISNGVEFWGDPKDISSMISNWNLLTAAQELQDRLELAEVDDFLKKVFRDKNVKPTESHLILPTIPFRSILTSNYDTLIESAYTIQSGGVSQTVFTQQDLGKISSPLRKEDFYIFKIHGDINRVDTIVLGSRDYQNLFYQSPAYRQFLETLFSVHTVLFIGFGGSDPDLDNVLERLSTIYSRSIGKHYILWPETKFNLTEKRRLLLDKRLQVIDYKKDKSHSQVNAFISDLSKIFKTIKPAVPKQKAKPKYDVFLSYTHKDEEIANRILDFLKTNNITAFLAQQHLDSGTILSRTISERIYQSKVMIVLMTENSIKSESVKAEVNMAMMREFENKIKVLPITIGKINYTDMPMTLHHKMYFAFDNDFGVRELNNLLEDLKSIIAAANNRACW